MMTGHRKSFLFRRSTCDINDYACDDNIEEQYTNNCERAVIGVPEKSQHSHMCHGKGKQCKNGSNSYPYETANDSGPFDLSFDGNEFTVQLNAVQKDSNIAFKIAKS